MACHIKTFPTIYKEILYYMWVSNIDYIGLILNVIWINYEQIIYDHIKFYIGPFQQYIGSIICHIGQCIGPNDMSSAKIYYFIFYQYI